MPYSVGLSGSIASGKSTVAQLFADLGVEIINADVIAKALTAINEPAYHEIIEHFGSKILREDNSLNRRELRDIIFSTPSERTWLEGLLHPLIRKKIAALVASSSKIYTMVEIPLLIDKANYPYLNKILIVTAPKELQLARIIARDQCTEEQARAILDAQPPLDLRLRYADDILFNDMSLIELKTTVNALHDKYMRDLQQ